MVLSKLSSSVPDTVQSVGEVGVVVDMHQKDKVFSSFAAWRDSLYLDLDFAEKRLNMIEGGFRYGLKNGLEEMSDEDELNFLEEYWHDQGNYAVEMINVLDNLIANFGDVRAEILRVANEIERIVSFDLTDLDETWMRLLNVVGIEECLEERPVRSVELSIRKAVADLFSRKDV